MDWATVAMLIAQYGIPLTEKLIQKWSAGEQVTPAAFAELKAMAAQTAKDRMTAQLTAAGIPLDDPKAVALLKLVGG